MHTSSRTGDYRHPMRIVTRRTGLSADLLRAWEKRYEVVTPSRSEGGRRLYSDGDIARLGLLYRATMAGRSIGQVAPLPTEALATLVRQDAAAEAEAARAATRAPRTALETPPHSATADYLADCLRAIERFDTTALNATLQHAAIALPVAVLFDALVVPLLERVDTRWREGTLRPAHGQLASAALQHLLYGVIERASTPLATANLVVAAPAGQVDDFGALLVAATAATEKWRVTYLGGDLPAEDIAEAAVRTRARAVALSIVYLAGRPALGDEIRRLRKALPKNVALVVGGAGSSAYRAMLDEIGAVQLNTLADWRTYLRTHLRTRRRAQRR
jgi:DNA-binding transcriptional MerR regulator/methylmalonyl-CoA mutase cobalamin-binding subunit